MDRQEFIYRGGTGFKSFVLRLFLLGGSPVFTVQAASGVTCHCFQDRAFSPSSPAAVDPYLLATTQNSTLAVTYGVARKGVVKQKMLGSRSDDLWIAYDIATNSGVAVEELLEMRNRQGSWLPLEPDGVSLRLPEYLRDIPPRTWVQTIVDRAAHHSLKLSREDLEGLRRVEATDQELLLSGLLAWKLGRPAMELLAQARSAESSWGMLSHFAEIDPREIESLIRTLANQSKRR